MNVYLAGAINGKSDDEANGWRDRIIEALPDINFLNPMDRDYRGIEGDHTETIVEGDLADIDTADAFVAYCPSPSWGTAMEVLYAARMCQLPVLLVVPENAGISPWLRYHSDAIVTSVDGAVEWLDAAQTVLKEAESEFLIVNS